MKIPGTDYIDLKSATGTIKLKAGKNRFEWNATSEGTFQLSDSDMSLYCITIWKNNGHLTLADATGRVLTKFPSVFTGSFNLVGGSKGLYARCGGVNGKMTPLCVTWMEKHD